MRKLFFIAVLAVSFSAHTQAWFQGGTGSGNSYSEVSFCDTQNLNTPFQASNASNSGFSFSEALLCNSNAYFGSAGAGDNFIYAPCLFVLPIELISFTVIAQESRVKINWETVSELNNDYFTVERSSNQVLWDEVEIIDGAGTSTELLRYQTIDAFPLYEVSYYRLKQTDFDGVYKYSKIRSVVYEKSLTELTVFPNPSAQLITLVGFKAGPLKVFNVLGQNVTTQIQVVYENQTRMQINLQNLSAGMYLFSVGPSMIQVAKK